MLKGKLVWFGLVFSVTALLLVAACTGPAGTSGTAGSQGPAGAQGPAGVQGPAGADGAAGASGSTADAAPGGASIAVPTGDVVIGTGSIAICGAGWAPNKSVNTWLLAGEATGDDILLVGALTNSSGAFCTSKKLAPRRGHQKFQAGVWTVKADAIDGRTASAPVTIVEPPAEEDSK